MTSQIVWTCLPNGIATTPSGNVLQLSVFISPRLGDGTTLGSYSDWVDWPAKLASMGTLSIAINGPAKPYTIPAANSQLWQAMFPASTFVRPYAFEDNTSTYIFSYSVSNMAANVQNLYKLVALNSPTTPPLITVLQRNYGFTNLIPGNAPNDTNFGSGPLTLPYGAGLERQLGDYHQKGGQTFPPNLTSFTGNFVGAQVTTQQQYDMFKLQVFHQPRTHVTADPATGYPMAQLGPLPAPTDFQNMLDFHQRVGMLAKFPLLMRALGLVLDFQIPVTGISVTGGLMAVSLPSPNVTPRTVLTSGGDFHPAPKSLADIADGYLNLGPKGSYDFIDFDVDGASLKLLSTAATIYQSRRHISSDTPATSTLASLRSAGLSIVRRQRAQQLINLFQSAKNNNDNVPTNSVTLYADDLLRGFRVDVSDDYDPKWLSLFQRVGAYNIINNTALSQTGLADEGFTELAATSPSNPVSPTTDLYLHESLMRWDGWSEVAPRPGNTVTTDGTDSIGNDAAPGLPLSATFTVPKGTLPKLRFGRSYRFRGRAVDLAGNSLPVTDTSSVYASTPKFYARWEPVVSPPLAVRSAPDTGESLNNIAIRSFNATPAQDGVTTVQVSDRHIAPPRASVELSEAHGMLDNPVGLNHAYYPVISSLDKPFQTLTTGPSASPSTFPYDPRTQAILPYLPDPMATGATLQYLPGSTPTTVQQIAFSDTGPWPYYKPFRIHLVEGPYGSSYDATSRLLTLSLPKAGTATVNLMSQLPGVAPGHALGSTPPSALELMGIWRLIEQAAPANLATLKGYALQSLIWLLTPSHQINLTHAVQQPLVTPSFQALVPIRSLGVTYADFIARVNADGQSTSQLDFDATWTEPYDNPSDPLSLHPDIDRKNGHAAAFQLQLRFPGPLVGPFAVASPVPIQDESGNVLGQYNTAAQTVTFGSTSPTGGVINLRRQEFHDTKYRRVGYTPIATTRFREFFTLPITPTLNPYIRQAASPTVIDIPSTARPAAPNILYVIPTFRHTTAANGAARQGGFRVYMDRPWFSSGDGELLAAVMWNPTYVTIGITAAETTKPGKPTTVKPSSVVPTTYQATLPDKFKPYVTMWGADPMFTSLAPVITPAPSYFTNQAVTTGFNTTSLTLEELPGETVSIAAHNVAFDPVRNLWYCDIDINPVAMYMPFVRLGLARYQPHSVPGAELSKVVLSEFVQLTPTRAASLTPFKDPHFLQVAVSGFSYSSSQSFVDQVITGTSLVVVSLEARSSTDPADDVAWIPLPQYDVTLPFAVTNNGANLWKGSFKLPPAVSGTQYRLVFREYELLNASSTALPAFNPETNFELGYRRLVFAETVDITSIMPTS